MSNIIGIDLGTTFSAIAKLDDYGQPAVIPVGGERIMASCVWVKSTDNATCGAEAYNELPNEAESVIRMFKRDMGAEKIYTTPNGGEQTPIAASALILRKLFQEASKTEGPIRDVVITVSAKFSERQRKATLAAGEQAGLNVINIINEPTAAILAYAKKHPVIGTVMVYDLGGGTFDVTIARVEGTEIECLTSEGDFYLGGIDFDRKIAEIIDKKYEQEYGRSLKDALGIKNEEDERKSNEWQSLLMEAERIKRALSKADSRRFRYNDGPDGNLSGEVTKKEFEQAISSLVARTEMLVDTALDNVNLNHKDIDMILLIGGSTRVPLVMESVKRTMGKEGSQEIDPDEAVALGAAIYAGLRSAPEKLKPMQREALKGIKVGDVANHFFGTIALGVDKERDKVEDKVTIILRKDTPIPCSNTVRLFTAADGQRCINFRLTQSAEEETDPEFVNVVWETELGPLPANRPAQQPLDITYSYDENQVMGVEVLDVKSGIIFNTTYSVKGSASAPISIPDFRID